MNTAERALGPINGNAHVLPRLQVPHQPHEGATAVFPGGSPHVAVMAGPQGAHQDVAIATVADQQNRAGGFHMHDGRKNISV